MSPNVASIAAAAATEAPKVGPASATPVPQIAREVNPLFRPSTQFLPGSLAFMTPVATAARGPSNLPAPFASIPPAFFNSEREPFPLNIPSKFLPNTLEVYFILLPKLRIRLPREENILPTLLTPGIFLKRFFAPRAAFKFLPPKESSICMATKVFSAPRDAAKIGITAIEKPPNHLPVVSKVFAIPSVTARPFF